ncbi:hypothetical protein KCU62_g368, partial [Aureobasidium sp. EXF-3399]
LSKGNILVLILNCREIGLHDPKIDVKATAPLHTTTIATVIHMAILPYCVDNELHDSATRLLTYTKSASDIFEKRYVSTTMAKKMSKSASLNSLFKITLLMILQNTRDPARMANMTSGITIALCRLSMAIESGAKGNHAVQDLKLRRPDKTMNPTGCERALVKRLIDPSDASFKTAAITV